MCGGECMHLSGERPKCVMFLTLRRELGSRYTPPLHLVLVYDAHTMQSVACRQTRLFDCKNLSGT